MSTTGYENWAVDLKDVGAIYPFQGSEGVLVLIAVALWIVWHIVQIKNENKEIEYEKQHNHRKENIEQSVDRY